MATGNTPPKRFTSRYAGPGAAPPPNRQYRLAFRLIGIPIVAVVGVFLYSGLRDYIVLPACDSARARQTLSDIFKQLKYVPLRYEPIKTISSSKDEVVCNATLPLPDGATVVADYTFTWQANKASMKYSVFRKAPGK